MRGAEEKARKGLVRLLQFLLPGPAVRLGPETACPATRETEIAARPLPAQQPHPRADMPHPAAAAGTHPAPGIGMVALRSARGQRQEFPLALLSLCARQGLIRLEGDACRALPPAQALLKRLILGAELGFPGQHGALAEEERLVEGEARRVTVNQAVSPLVLLKRLKGREGEPWFPPEAIAAGERLHADFTFGGLQPRITAAWQPRLEANRQPGAGGGAALSDHAADARARVSRAAAALGPELSGVALDICCFEKGLEEVERERQWPARSAKLMLRTALTALARHYGLSGG